MSYKSTINESIAFLNKTDRDTVDYPRALKKTGTSAHPENTKAMKKRVKQLMFMINDTWNNENLEFAFFQLTHFNDRSKIKDKTYIKIFLLIESYIVRNFLANPQSSQRINWPLQNLICGPTLSNLINNSKDQADILEGIKEGLTSHETRSVETPSDEDVIDALTKTQTIKKEKMKDGTDYKSSSEILKYILPNLCYELSSTIRTSYNQNNTTISPDIFDLMRNEKIEKKNTLPYFEIEHIMPQTYDSTDFGDYCKTEKEKDTYFQKIGNYTLLPGTINSQIKNRSWDFKTNNKKHNYSMGQFNMTIQLHLLPQWTPKHIKHRSQVLANAITNIWLNPDEIIALEPSS